MRTLREAGAGGVEPPSTVLETAMLPVTPCSRGSIHAERRNRTSNDRSGRLIYSQVQCHSASSAFRRSCFYSVVKKQKERVLPHTKRRNGPLLLSLLSNWVLRFWERESAPAGSTLPS